MSTSMTLNDLEPPKPGVFLYMFSQAQTRPLLSPHVRCRVMHADSRFHIIRETQNIHFCWGGQNNFDVNYCVTLRYEGGLHYLD